MTKIKLENAHYAGQTINISPVGKVEIDKECCFEVESDEVAQALIEKFKDTSFKISIDEGEKPEPQKQEEESQPEKEPEEEPKDEVKDFIDKINSAKKAELLEYAKEATEGEDVDIESMKVAELRKMLIDKIS